MAGVTPRQLRYWEQKGYIKAREVDGNKAREYDAQMMIKVIFIKHFLDEGYTLSVAVQKIQKHMANMKIVRSIIREHFEGIEELDGEMAVNLGYFDDTKQQILYAIVKEGHSTFKLVDAPTKE
ncbi:MerR family transcriptional regulator [Latilactobacillus sakei]|nr:MerR family transcriptional regulator [Latilactobacillus sakei]